MDMQWARDPEVAALQCYACGHWDEIESPAVYGARHGLLDLLEFAFFGRHWLHIDLCALARDVATLRFLCSKGCILTTQAECEFARRGEIEMLEFAFQDGILNDVETLMLEALRNEERALPTLKYLRTKVFGLPTLLIRAAATYGRLDVIQWARNEGCELQSREEAALIESRSRTWLFYRGGVYWDTHDGEHNILCKFAGMDDIDDVVTLAAVNGHVDVVEYLLRECLLDHALASRVVRAGKLDMLRFLVGVGIPLPKYTWHAAFRNDVAMLDYARTQGQRIKTKAWYAAAMEGHMDVLRYAHQHGYDLDENVCALAAKYGHLDALVFAHQCGAPLPRSMNGIRDERIVAYIEAHAA